MNPDADQSKLRLPKARVDCVFKRKNSRYYQARVWIGGKAVRRTTRALTKAGAKEAIPILRVELQRPPSTKPVTKPPQQLELV